MAQEKQDTGHGYWMYADGYSCWGIGLYRDGEVPIQIPVELHTPTKDAKGNMPTEAELLAKRLEFYAKAKAKAEPEPEVETPKKAKKAA